MSDTIIGLPIGSDVTYHFVFKDSIDQPLDLAGLEFIIKLRAKYPVLNLQFDTTADANIYVEEDAVISPVGQSTYVADRLVLVLEPAITRDIPPGALTRWEIEQRSGGNQYNWGSGIFSGYGGENIDV